jgi:site-specific recombinase XerD
LTSELCREYMKERLGHVLAVTVRKELTALRSFVGWLEEEGHIAKGSVVVPFLEKRVTGTNYKKRRRVASFELSPEQIRELIRRLPEWSSAEDPARFMVRARFLVQYETGLRPSTIERLRTPEHYRAGSKILKITKGIDKARFDRDVPLNRRARRVLDYVLRALERENGGRPVRGLIFGKHDHRKFLAAAAARALPPELAERFAGAHLRSARITHALERPGSNLPGVQYLAGHKQISTTARYVKPSFRAALDALGEQPTRGAERSGKPGSG